MEKDVTLRALEKVVASVERVRGKVKQRIPYGPKHVKLTRAEARKMLEHMSGQKQVQLAQQLGSDRFLEMLTELYGRVETHGRP